MPERRESISAMLVATIVFWLFGAAWYTLFSAPWMALMGKPLAEISIYGYWPYLVSLIGEFISAFAIARSLSYVALPSLGRGALIGVFLAVGIYGTASFIQTMYEGRPIALWLIDGGHVIVGMTIQGAIIGAWRTKSTPAV